MNKLVKMWVALWSAAFVVAAAPMMALAQSSGGPGGPINAPGPVRDTTGTSSGWLWLLLALAVIAVIWYAMSTRRTARQH